MKKETRKVKQRKNEYNKKKPKKPHHEKKICIIFIKENYTAKTFPTIKLKMCDKGLFKLFS